MTPGAWHDLVARLSQARAVAECVANALPECGMSPGVAHDVAQAHNLTGVLDMLLVLAEQDAERLEQQLLMA